jgi:DNA-binding transcriptional LysR family regulator
VILENPGPSEPSLLPSAGALFVFEAAARLGSFTRAEAELRMSQAAVSYAVKRLEATLGCRLFHRLHRRVELTEAGERFFHDVALGLGHVRRSAEAVRRASVPGHVTFSTPTAFAAFWMVPRLGRFRALHPAVDLRLQATDNRGGDLAGVQPRLASPGRRPARAGRPAAPYPDPSRGAVPAASHLGRLVRGVGRGLCRPW